MYVRACTLVAAAHPDARFVLIGDGELADLVDREVAAGGFDGRFHHLRLPSGGEAAMAELDVFVMSSRYEGAAYAPMEAMRARVPVVLTDVVGNRDAVEAGVSGLLVPPDDPATLARGDRASPRRRRPPGRDRRARPPAGRRSVRLTGTRRPARPLVSVCGRSTSSFLRLVNARDWP